MYCNTTNCVKTVTCGVAKLLVHEKQWSLVLQ